MACGETNVIRRACPSYRFRNISGANSTYPAEKCMTTIPNGIILYISGARRAPVRRHETLLVPTTQGQVVGPILGQACSRCKTEMVLKRA